MPGAECSFPALSVFRRRNLWRPRGRLRGVCVGLCARGFVLHAHVIEGSNPGTRRQTDDLAASLDWPALLERAHFSCLEPTGTHPYDRRAFAVCRLPVKKDDVKAVSLFSISLARRLFAHDALSA